MSCKVNYSKEGKITRVNEPDGRESTLFNRISRIPALDNLEQALDIFKQARSTNALAEEVEFISDDGSYHNTYGEALQKSSNIVKVAVSGGIVASVSANTNPDTKVGLINNLIVNGLVSDETYVENGEIFFQAEGYTGARAMVSQAIYRTEVKSRNFGKYDFKFDNSGVFQLEEVTDRKDSTNFTEVMQKHGREEAVNQFVRGALKEIMTQTTLREKGPLKTDENALRSNLLGLLEAMGVEVMSISEYIEKFQLRNGVEPTAEAIADIANSVVAFKNGEIDTDSLTEETIHFIIEAMPDTELAQLLEDVVNTDTYADIYNQYTELYTGQGRSAEEVENLVRREALAKELTKRIQGRFEVTEDMSQAEVSLMQRLLDLVQRFFTTINIQPQIEERLNTLTDKVEDLLIEKDVANFLNLEQLKNKKLQLYKAQPSGNGKVDSIVTLLRGITFSLTSQEKALRKSGQGSAHNIRVLNQISEDLSDATMKKSIAEILQISSKKIDYISQAIDRSEAESSMLTTEESAVLNELLTNTRTGLSRLANDISGVKELSDMVEEIEEVGKRINRLEGGVGTISKRITDRIIQRFIDRHPALANQSDEVKEQLRKALENAQADTNVIFSYYGQITHAQDPILNMLGMVIADMTNKAEMHQTNRTKDFMEFLRENKFNPQDLKKFSNGKGWFRGPWKFDEFHKDLLEAQITSHNKALVEIGKTAFDVKELEKFYQGKLKELPEEGRLGTEGRFKFGAFMEIALEGKIEKPMIQEYYKQRRELYETGVEGGPISTVAQIALREISAIRSELNRNSIVRGKVVLNRYTKLQMDELATRRRSAKDIYDVDGNFKEGIEDFTEAQYASEIKQPGDVKVGDVWIRLKPNASDEAIIAYDIQRIDAQFKKDIDSGKIDSMFKNDKLSKEFLDTIKEMEADPTTSRQQVIDYFLTNVNINFTQEFWEDFGQNRSYTDKLEEFFSGNNPEVSDSMREDYEARKKLIKQRTRLVRKYQDSKNASNIAVANMSSATREAIIELTEEIGVLGRSINANTALKEFLGQEAENQDDSIAESSPNESYFGMLKDEGIDQDNTTAVINFTTKHMTAKNSAEVKSLAEALNSLVKNGIPLPLAQQKAFTRVFGEGAINNIDKSNVEFFQRAFAESRLEVYFKTLAPNDVGILIREMSNEGTQTPFSHLITQLEGTPYVELSNHYTYYGDNTSDQQNSNYIKDFAGGMYQPSLSRYGDTDFINKYGIKIDETGVTGDNSTDFQVYQQLMEFQKVSLTRYGEYGSHNIYKMPQISKTSMDTMLNILKGSNSKALVKEVLERMKRFRVDEMEYGQEDNGESLYSTTGLKVMPKMYLRDLEIQENISDDVIYSIMAMAQQSELYKARQETFSDVLALQETLIKRGNKEGKKSEATNTYKMFTSYVDQNYFGINETFNKKVTLPILGEVDIANVVSTFHKLIRWKNLAYKVIIPLTSLFTAKVQFFIEQLVGQYVDKGSVKLARKAFNKKAMSTVNETFKIDSQSELNVLGQYLGVFDLESTFKDSKYSRFTRLLGNLGYGLHTAGNFEPLSMAMLSTLYGHRIYNKQIVDYNTFNKMTGKDSKTTKALWKTLEDKSVYNYIGVKAGKVEVDYRGLSDALERPTTETGAEFSEFYHNFENSLRNKAKKLVERIDGNIRAEERTMLQRNFIGKYVMTHKGWLAIAMANRFKGKHLNFQTGQEEEGSYMTLGRLFSKTFDTAFKKDGKKKIIEQYNNMTDLEKTNLRRVALELSVAGSMYLIGLMATAFGNDDDNKDLMSAQLMAYMLERMSNETNSTQFGIGDEIYKSVKEPIVGLKQITDIFNVIDAVDSTKVKSGNYAGMSRSSMYWIKNLAPLKEAYLFSDPNHLYKQRQSYQHFNDPTDFQMLSLLVTPKDVKEWFE